MPNSELRLLTCVYGIALNTHSNDFIRGYIERVTSRKRKNHFGSCCEGVVGEGGVVGIPKFHS